jgi:8-oxo-dGTP pyrophosphatase MutT (NUDIX family)
MCEPPCSGIIVIDKINNEAILVCTERDNYSFPKGKRHKGERSIDTATRETFEETGLDQNDYDLIANVHFDENSDRGNIATRYYVGILKSDKKPVQFDKEELKNVVWMTFDEIFNLEKFKDRRKGILRSVIEIL